MKGEGTVGKAKMPSLTSNCACALNVHSLGFLVLSFPSYWSSNMALYK